MTEHSVLPLALKKRGSDYDLIGEEGKFIMALTGFRYPSPKQLDRFITISHLIVTACNNYEKLVYAIDELLEVANLRGDNQLPAPEDDPGLWTARMQTAWDELAAIRNAKEQTK